MVCPFCLHNKTEVYNSRPTKRLNRLWRRRHCPSCTRNFTTHESIDITGAIKVTSPSKPTNKNPYSPATLLLSIIKVCDHQATPDNAYWLCQTIEQDLIRLAAKNHNTISTEQIVSTCLSVLKNFDTPAFVKYLSYHSDASSIAKHLKHGSK